MTLARDLAQLSQRLSLDDQVRVRLLGGTLVTRHGKGRFVYTGLAFFRQLPAGVPGAYRLLVNLIAPEPAP